MMWTPRFACPECDRPLASGAPVTCACGQAYKAHNGTHVFLTSSRRLAAQAFAGQYRRVRALDGHQRVVQECWTDLPRVPRTHPAAGEWRIRCESYERLRRSVLGRSRRRVLDLGAGSGWLASRLATEGHDLVALDRWDDETDEVALHAHEGRPIVRVQADFDALPFLPGQFDLVVFGASLHYAPDPARTVAGAVRMLAGGGVLAVMDSPMFARATHGEAMVTAQAASLSSECGLGDVHRSGAGYLTFDALDSAARGVGRHGQFLPSRGSLPWRVRRSVSRLRLGRAPAAFGLWVAR